MQSDEPVDDPHPKLFPWPKRGGRCSRPSSAARLGTDLPREKGRRWPRLNWAGNYEYRAARIARPQSVDELRELVVGAPSVRALGSRHSFNDLADTTELLVSTAGLPSRDHDRRGCARRSPSAAGCATATSPASCRRPGWALHNLASLPHISVAGAIATATHGSGDRNGNLATAVSGAAHPAGRRRARRPAARGPRLRRRSRLARRARRRHRGDARHPSDASTYASGSSAACRGMRSPAGSTTLTSARVQRQPLHDLGRGHGRARLDQGADGRSERHRGRLLRRARAHRRRAT